MDHDLALQGHRFGLRPVTLADASFIVGLRATCGRFLNRGALSEREQRAWIERYFQRPDDYYFIVERNFDGRPEGTAGIYDVEQRTQVAEWGRFVVQPGSLAAVEAALLVYRCGFETINVDRLRCRTLATNVRTVAFHDSCGLARSAEMVVIPHDGRACEAVEHILSRKAWTAVHDHLDRLAARLAHASVSHSDQGVVRR